MKKELLHTFSATSLGTISSKSDTNLIEDDDQTSCFSNWTGKTFQRKNFIRKLPIITWLPEYNLTKLVADLIAGITLGLTTIPQVLGVANVGEIPTEYGLYSSFVGCFVYIFMGSTKYITIGPTVTTAIITLSYTKGQTPEFSILLCFLTGVVTLLMSFLQLGFIVDLISKPVISGFTSAAAISITSTQIKSLLGISFSANGFVEEISGVIENISDTKAADSIVAVISLTALLVLMKIEAIFQHFGKYPPAFNKFLWVLSTSRNVTVVVVATAIFSWWDNAPTILLVGNVPGGMPSFKPPPFSFSQVNNATGQVMEFTLGTALREKTSALLVIPLIALMEHMTIAKAFSGTSRIDATQELLCLGLSNIIGSFFSSVPVTGAFGRTAINYASGAQTPLGGLVTGVIIILALLVFTPWFYYIPKATLNSIVICAVIFMVDFEILKSIWRSKKLDLVPWIVTFLVSLFVGLEYGIMSGFAVSVVFTLYYAARPGVLVNKGLTGNGVEFLWVEVDRSLTFPSMEYTRYTIMKAATTWGKGQLPVVLDCQYIKFADYTAAQGISDLFKLFKEKNQELILWQVKPSVVRIWTSVMNKNGVNFSSCSNEAELEVVLDQRRIEMKENADVNVDIPDNNNLQEEHID